MSIKLELEDVEQTYLNNYSRELRLRISELYKTTPHILRSQIEDEFYIQNGIKFLFKHLIVDELQNKPINITNTGNNKESQEKKEIEFFDPFSPPFPEGHVIEENFGGLDTHRIFFSKFAVMPEHILLVTRNFYSQYTHLTYEDFKNSTLLLKVMNGVIFFNGGKNAGASQPRKHLQCIPLSSMYDGDFGIFNLIKNEENLEIENSIDYSTQGLGSMQIIKKFSENGINHILIKFSKQISDTINNLNENSIDIISDLLFSFYNMGLIKLNLLEDEENIISNYSVLLSNEWMFIVPRKTHLVNLSKGQLNINSIGFLMTMLIKSNELCDEVKTKNILKEIYAEL
jgi:sulfate adenylyltransferase (ADP) / ATP adenylyltransferase